MTRQTTTMHGWMCCFELLGADLELKPTLLSLYTEFYTWIVQMWARCGRKHRVLGFFQLSIYIYIRCSSAESPNASFIVLL